MSDMKTTALLTRSLLLTALAMASTPQPAQAALSVGDPAPKLQVAKWMQGEPVKEFEREHVYIVEFWATWCGPCRVSIPHLNALHEKFKDKGIIVIGQDVWENDETKVEPFVKKMGKDMTYRVALDDKSQKAKGAMSETWMAAAGRGGIPSAFVVNKQGRIAWIGHPMGLNEKLLEDILAERFDIAKFAESYNREQAEQRRRTELSTKLRTALKDKNWDAADAAVTELEKAAPAANRYQYGTTRIQILLGRGDHAAAAKLARSLSESQAENAFFLNSIAFTLAADKALPKSELELAESIAGRANQSSKGKNASILSTLARIQFKLGKTDEAIATQELAVKAAPKGAEKTHLKTLEEYKSSKSPVGT